ncbi:MAG: tandem-95 repeat protein [Planctomycetes bacterium]|nr:tandem-95 repeat protein [Planctomycetota bacterium]
MLEDRRLLAGAPPFLDGVEVGAMETDRIIEPSGLVVSQQHADVIWTHNDSGGNPELFAADTTGRHLGAYNLVGADLVDWEDIAIGPGPQAGVDYLYIADTGDNSARHDSVFLYRVAEPAVDSQQQPADFDLTDVERFEFVYPDGARDAETLLVDPTSGDVVIVSKRDEQNHVYLVTQEQLDQLEDGETHTLDLLGTTTWGDAPGDGELTGAVGGDVSADGREILIKSYKNVYYYSRAPGSSIAEAIIDVEPVTVPYTPETKGESIAFDSHTGGYYTLNEINDHRLRFYERDIDVTPPAPRVISPLDNGPEDVNPASGELFVALPSLLQIQLVDLEVDDATVTPAVLSMTRFGNPFEAYTFDYDVDTDVITLTPEGDTFNRGTYTITLSPAGDVIADVEGNQTPETTLLVEVSVGLPTIPLANDDAYVILEDGRLDVDGTEGILDNDDSAFNSPFVAVLLEGPQHGTLQLSGGGGVIYVPERDFFGSDSFTYFVDGRFFDSDVATVTLTVEPVNDPPVVEDDTYRLVQGAVLEVGAGAASPERIAGTGFEEPSIGAQRYTAGAAGNDELGFDGTVDEDTEVGVHAYDNGGQQMLVHEGDLQISTDLVDLSRHEQVYVSVDLRTWEDSPGSDFERDLDTIRVFVEASENGVDFTEIDITPGTLTGGERRNDPQDQLKSLDGGENGPLTTFGVNIPEHFTSLRVVIEALNTSSSERFMFDNILISGIPDNAGRGVLNNDFDVEGDPLVTELVDPPEHGMLALQPNGAFLYTPDARFVGDDTFTYRVSDGQAESGLATVTITVDPLPDRVARGLIALYELEEGQGDVLHDTSGVGAALDLTIADVDAARWIPGGLSIESTTIVSSAAAADKIHDAVTASGEISFEAWVLPSSVDQSGPARILTFSDGPSGSNFTLGQAGAGYVGRLRTTTTGPNGSSPELTATNVLQTEELTHVVYTRDAAEMARIYVDGSQVASAVIDGDFSSWDAAFRLALANEFGGERPWLGEIHLAAVYAAALSAEEVDQNFRAGANPISLPPAEVVGRYVFYNDSIFDGDDPAAGGEDGAAIAPDKSALLPGETADFTNYTSFEHGVNGVMIDVQDLASTVLDESSFELHTGNTPDPADWPLADLPTITVRPGAGANNSDRITLVWPNGALANTWLQVTLKAGEATGLEQDDVFFFGSAVGDVGGGNLAGVVLVDGVDRAVVRQNLSDASPAPIDSPFDFNRDGRVDETDRAIVRQNPRNFLTGLILLTAPTPAAPAPPSPRFAVAGPLPDFAETAAEGESLGDRSNRRRAGRRASQSFFDRLGQRPDDNLAPISRSSRRATRLRGATLRRLQATAVDRSIDAVDLLDALPRTRASRRGRP